MSVANAVEDVQGDGPYPVGASAGKRRKRVHVWGLHVYLGRQLLEKRDFYCQRVFPSERTIYHSDEAFQALPTALVDFSLKNVYVAQILSNVVYIQSPLMERKARKGIVP